jgi:hypothetical protein
LRETIQLISGKSRINNDKMSHQMKQPNIASTGASLPIPSCHPHPGCVLCFVFGFWVFMDLRNFQNAIQSEKQGIFVNICIYEENSE